MSARTIKAFVATMAILAILAMPDWALARKNIALGKKGITASKEPGRFLVNEQAGLEILTDGSHEPPWYVDLCGPNEDGLGLQWVQIDLEAVYLIGEIIIWHYWPGGRTYHETKTAVSTTGKFKGEETVVFDSAKEGEYPETEEGHHIKIKPLVQARYIRDWANGSTSNKWSHWMEIEIDGVIYAITSPLSRLTTTWGSIKARY